MRRRFFSCAAAILLAFASLVSLVRLEGSRALVAAQADCQAFPETGKTVCGRFLQYWQEHGGLAQQGYPISDVIGETSAVDGRIYTVQYFERAVFEYHPENQPPNDVELSLLGVFLYQQKYPTGAPSQVANSSAGSMLFGQTSHRVGGGFLDYWKSHGGLAQQGYPISEEFTEVSDLNGQTYRVQYKQNLGDTTWLDLTPDVTATGPAASTTDTISASSQRFYRVAVLP